MSRYADGTSVDSYASRAEIERTLMRYGASGFAYGTDWDGGRAGIEFQFSGRRYRINLPLPSPNERRFTHTPSRGTARSSAAARAEYEQAVRQRWRALALWIKATLEAAESGIVTVEEALLSAAVLPSGGTFGAWAGPQLEAAYADAQMPALLPGGGGS